MDNLSRTQVALSECAIHQRDGPGADGVSKGPSTHHHLYPEEVTAWDGERNDVSQNSSFIQAERAREVAHTGIEHGAYEKVGAAGDKLALEA